MFNAQLTYRFVLNDYNQGIEYGVSAEVYNNSMAAIGSELKTEESVRSEKFLFDFYNEYHKKEKEAR